MDLSYMDQINNRLLKNTAWNFFHEAVNKGSLFLANLYLARILGPESFGILVLSQVVTMYVWIAVDLGTSIYGIREVGKSKNDAQEVLNQLLTMRITLGSIIFAVYVIFIVYFIDIEVVSKLTFIGSGLYLFAYSLYTDWVLKGLEKFNTLSFSGFIFAISYLIGLFFFVKKENDVIIAAFIWSLSFLVAALSMFAIMHRVGLGYRPCFKLKTWWTHIRESIIFTFAGLISAGYMYLPFFIIGKLLSQQELGLFSAPFRIVQSITAPGFYIAMAFFPVLCDLYYNNYTAFKKVVAKLQAIMLIFGGVIGIIGHGFSKRINLFLLGEKYSRSSDIFAILVLLIPIIFIRYSYTTSLRASLYQKYQLIPFFVSTGTLLCLYLIIQHIGVFDLFNFSVVLVLAEISLLLTLLVISKMTYDRPIKKLF
jgi:O-antigen/teichoic acid export membrane protein